MLLHGFAPASNLHPGYTLPSVRSSLRWVMRLRALVVALPLVGQEVFSLPSPECRSTYEKLGPLNVRP